MKLSINIDESITLKYIAVSCANRIETPILFSTLHGGTLINITIKSRPKAEPWETPIFRTNEKHHFL